jgi:hypothetical protein
MFKTAHQKVASEVIDQAVSLPLYSFMILDKIMQEIRLDESFLLLLFK